MPALSPPRPCWSPLAHDVASNPHSPLPSLPRLLCLGQPRGPCPSARSAQLRVCAQRAPRHTDGGKEQGVLSPGPGASVLL